MEELHEILVSFCFLPLFSKFCNKLKKSFKKSFKKQTRQSLQTVPLSYALLNEEVLDFLGGAVVKNPPANARDTGSIPGQGRSHMPQSN